jgi:hypothetical protein
MPLSASRESMHKSLLANALMCGVPKSMTAIGRSTGAQQQFKERASRSSSGEAIRR